MLNVRRHTALRTAGSALFAIAIATSFNASSNTLFSLDEPSYVHFTSEIIPSLSSGHWLHQDWMLDASGHNVSGCLVRQIPGAPSARRTCYGSAATGEYASITRVIAVTGGAIGIGQRGTITSSGTCRDCSAWLVMLDDTGAERWSKRLGDSKFHFGLSSLLLNPDGSIWLAGNRQDLILSKQQAWLGKISVSGELLSEFTLDQHIVWYSGDFGYGPFEMASDYEFDIQSMAAMPDGGFAISGSAKFTAGDAFAGFYVPESENVVGFAARFDSGSTPRAIWARQYRGTELNVRYTDIKSNVNGEMVMIGQSLPTIPDSQIEHLLTKVAPDGVTEWSQPPVTASHTVVWDYASAAIDAHGYVFLQSSARTTYSPVYTQTVVSSFSPAGTALYSINSVRENEGSEYSGYGGYGALSDETYPVGMYLSSDHQLVIGGESHALRRGLTTDLTSTENLYSIDPFSVTTDATALVTNSCLWSTPAPSSASKPLFGPLFQEATLSPMLQTLSRSTLADWPINHVTTYVVPSKKPVCSPANE